MIQAKRKKVTQMKKHQGTIRQKTQGGPYYYRVTVQKGMPRKEFPLKTNDPAEAEKRAAELATVLEAQTKEVALAQISAIKGFSRRAINLSLTDAWSKYEVHPERAMPHTVSEHQSYRSTFEEFVSYITQPSPTHQKKHLKIAAVAEICPAVCEEYAAYLKTTGLAVDTHNRKIKRLRKIFDCLRDYYADENPFKAKSLLRSPREEQNTIVRRQAFTKDQELAILNALADPKHKLINKNEIRLIYTLGMFTGQRLKDCVLLQWQNIDLGHDRIFVCQFKTGKEVSIPIAPQLREMLMAAKQWQTNQYVCPNSAARYNKSNRDGKNIGNNLVNIDVLRVIRWIGLEPSINVAGRNKKMTVYGFHSLRHSFASFCATAGVPKAVLLSILGTDSEIADKYYTHVGDESQRQAIAAISGTMQNITPQDRINKVLALLQEKPKPSKEILERIRLILSI